MLINYLVHHFVRLFAKEYYKKRVLVVINTFIDEAPKVMVQFAGANTGTVRIALPSSSLDLIKEDFTKLISDLPYSPYSVYEIVNDIINAIDSSIPDRARPNQKIMKAYKDNLNYLKKCIISWEGLV